MVKKKEEVVETALVQETPAMENPIKEEIIATLQKTGRENIGALIGFMEEIGFFTAPASGGNHSNGEGGLAEHSLNVSHMAEKLSVALIGGANITDEIRNSVVIVALLHDLGKCGDYGKQMWYKSNCGFVEGIR